MLSSSSMIEWFTKRSLLSTYMLAATCTANGTSFANNGWPRLPRSPIKDNGSVTSLGILTVAKFARSRIFSSDFGGTGTEIRVSYHELKPAEMTMAHLGR